jgi:O-antigen/teichoic acid export membrane protein
MAAREVQRIGAEMLAYRRLWPEIRSQAGWRDLPVVKEVSRSVNSRAPRQSTLVAYKATADVISKSVTLLVTIFAARVLAPEAFGLLALAMTTGWLLGVASDAGLPLYLARAVATNAGQTAVVWRQVMRLRTQFGLAAFVVAVVVAWIFAAPGYRLAFALIASAQIAGSVLETLAHVYRGLGRTDIESTITIGQRLAAAALVVVVLTLSPNFLWLAIALVVPAVAALLTSLAIAARIAGDVPSHGVTPLRFGNFARDAAPIGLGILVSALYFRCDVYFINHWQGLGAVGMYNAVFRLVEALRLFPAAVLAVVFPELCRAQTTRPMWRLALMLATVGALAMACTILSAPSIVHIAYGPAYQPAALPLQILGLAVPFFFLNYALTHQVIAWNGQYFYLTITIAALATNVICNALLIPSMGIAGAAFATILTEIVVTAGCVMALQGKGAQR